MQLSETLISYAKSIGIDAIGITSAERFTQEEATLLARSEAGMYPPFAEPDIALRCNPTAILPGCSALVVVAMSYLPPKTTCAHKRNTGIVALYARGNDYHQVLRSKLQQLADYLTQHSHNPHRYAISVDNGPCLERAAAIRAGLGRQGKNNLLYIKGLGSWVVLGVLLTSIPLTANTTAHETDCGTCNRCLRACPTQALVAPYTLDAKRCVAYITQMPGQIPRAYRRLMGTRLWGCDVCQTTCPWNKSAQSSAHPEWGAPMTPPELLSLLTMSKSEFTRRFGHTAINWRGKGTLQRNAAIALGNAGSIEAVPTLAEYLQNDAKPVLRAACAWSLGRIGGNQAKAYLLAAQQNEVDMVVQDEIAHALELC